MGLQELTLDVEDVQLSGDLAYEVGTATLRIQPPGDQPKPKPSSTS
jgi:hypothetical protein